MHHSGDVDPASSSQGQDGGRAVAGTMGRRLSWGVGLKDMKVTSGHEWTVMDGYLLLMVLGYGTAVILIVAWAWGVL